jgi:hypothetical protein
MSNMYLDIEIWNYPSIHLNKYLLITDYWYCLRKCDNAATTNSKHHKTIFKIFQFKGEKEKKNFYNKEI